MSSLLNPDGMPNWQQTGKNSWKLRLGESLLTIEVYDDIQMATLWLDGGFVKRFRGEGCVEQLNKNVLRRMKKIGIIT